MTPQPPPVVPKKWGNPPVSPQLKTPHPAFIPPSYIQRHGLLFNRCRQ
uniref:Uncharacterized protein n=1 Tax=Meloidogyne enterolobii TaxID=390850 RepID=A0A6V7WRD1_MELEN|nr:unnamed protein product [Meloidogyne enterolobii]